MSIWGHTLVKNEDRHLWFAVTSAIDYLDKLLLWDTGSKDDTVKIAKKLQEKYPDKIEFEEVGEVDISEFTEVRNKMLEQTRGDWLLVLDGDEVWWEDSTREAVELIKKQGDRLETIVTPVINVVGDIYHYQEEAAGRYEIDGQKGHYNIRFVKRSIPGLHLEKPHGTQGFFDEDGREIQKREKEKRHHMQGKLLHFTHLSRSSSKKGDKSVPKRAKKYKYEMGERFPPDFYYPEALFKPRPSFVKSPWERMSKEYFFRALVQTPLKKAKRRGWLLETER